MIFFFIFALDQDKWYITSAASLVIIIGLIIELLYFIEKYHRTLNKLLLAIKHKDFTRSFGNGVNRKIPLEQLNAFDEIINAFQNVRIDKEGHFEYLQALIEHMTVGIVCLENNNLVYLANSSAKDILHVNLLNKLNVIKRVDPILYKVFYDIKSTEKKIVKTSINNEDIQLLIWCSELKISNRPYKIISFQNIKSELDQQELESWQKLIRILNHEIMNTVTPISSLSSEINEMLEDRNGKRISLDEIEKEDMNDIYNSLKTIERRSKGLLKFVKTYKNIARLPKPNLENFRIKDLFNSISILLEPELKKEKINFSFSISEASLQIVADREMMEQVIINLILNAKDAVSKILNPTIELKAYVSYERTHIEISDNGCGIEVEHADNVFVPFFTTKKSGSGIGLSLSRQIINLHKGTIQIQSKVNYGTVVKIIV